MCGIAGIVRSSGPVMEHMLRRMVNSLSHRGPDDSGVWFNTAEHDLRTGGATVLGSTGVGLGHTRLAVIDLSPAGHQPMSNEDGTIWISFNGEIYNFQELREELIEKGHRFRSATDTEVIIHLYEEYGDQSVMRLNGMFAFALWDGRRSRLFAARDRVGIKPFYYTHQCGAVAFASEIKALIAADVVSRDVNWQAIYDYFTFLYVPNPATAFRGVLQLPPGHTLVYEPASDRLTVDRYWRAPVSNGPTVQNRGEWLEQFGLTMTNAVRRQLVSDVPLGCFLSGGVDSTILVGLMAQATRRVKTFTVRFEGTGTATFDEHLAAERVARRYDTEHHELVVDVSDPGEVLAMVEQFDQPFANPTFYLSALMSRYTRRHVTVALAGAGADELFAGYPRYQAVALAQSIERWPRVAISLAAAAARALPISARSRQIHRAKLFFDGLESDFSHRYLKWAYYLDERRKGHLLNGAAPRSTAGGLLSRTLDTGRIMERLMADSPDANDLARIRHADLSSFLPDNILEYTDKTSSAVALELRVPYLDAEVVELCLQAPVEANLRSAGGVTSKALLREAFGYLIPKENLHARKRGFCPPLILWMEKYFDRYFDVFLTRSYLADQGVFDWEAVQQLRAEHRSRRRDNSMDLFGILMFDAWYRRYITADTPEALAEIAA
jgi:asparagine synthase (glutamine-hydrolysing)